VKEQRAKYSADELDALGKKGQAFKNDDGSYSYPIADAEDLKKAIRAVGRGGADHDAIRKYVIKRAKALGESDLIPDNWGSDGSLKEAKSLRTTQEQRDTANDVFAALQGAVDDEYGDQFDSWWVWVQDWYGAGTDSDPYTVVFMAGDSLYAAPFSYDDQEKVVLGDAVKVRPVTSYVERGKVSQIAEWRKRKAESIRGTMEHREFSGSDLEMREESDGTLKLVGYASRTESPYEVGFYTETIKRGAFKRTLGENPDVQLLVNHEGLPLARTKSGTMRLEEDDLGLRVEADLDPQDPDVQSLSRKMARGDIDQMSFAFKATDQDWSEDFTSREIKGCSIHRGDVSVVNMGANEMSLAAIRSAEAIDALHRCGPEAFIAAWAEWRDHTLLPLEQRAGKALSSATMEVLSQVLNLIAAADDAVDEAQPLLADLMGVPNPDDDSGAEDTGGSAQDSGEADPTEGRTAAIPDHTTRARQQFALLRSAR
jgi:HK97 family phage prohead protease